MRHFPAFLIVAAVIASTTPAQERRRPDATRTEPRMATAEAPLQDAARAEAGARQWATAAFIQAAPVGFQQVHPRYGQMVGQQALIRISLVSPLLGENRVGIECFDASGSSLAVQHATIAEAGGGAFSGGRFVMTGRSARIVNVKTSPGVETWCRVTGTNPLLATASRVSYERLANPDQDVIRITESPIATFVLAE